MAKPTEDTGSNTQALPSARRAPVGQNGREAERVVLPKHDLSHEDVVLAVIRRFNEAAHGVEASSRGHHDGPAAGSQLILDSMSSTVESVVITECRIHVLPIDRSARPVRCVLRWDFDGDALAGIRSFASQADALAAQMLQ